MSLGGLPLHYRTRPHHRTAHRHTPGHSFLPNAAWYPRSGRSPRQLIIGSMGSAPAARSGAQRAVTHVASRSSGGPLDPELRVTLAEASHPADALDDYIEAHVHGAVRLDQDVEAVVLDRSFRGTRVEEAANGLGCPVEWHGGFRLGTAELARHPDYRGPRYVRLGIEIAVGGRLDPRIIGDAARTGRHDEQDLKRVWHYVARFGSPG